MVILVLGPNGSGKSAYAEKLARDPRRGENHPFAVYYIAAMIPYGAEGLARVEKHRKQRENMGFITVEKPFCVAEIPLPPEAAVLLEDVSNLLGNALFSRNRNESEDSVYQDITDLCAKCRTAVLVSIGGLTPAPEYDGETRGYIEALNRLNRRLYGFADTVVIMRDGKPEIQKEKGTIHALD